MHIGQRISKHLLYRIGEERTFKITNTKVRISDIRGHTVIFEYLEPESHNCTFGTLPLGEFDTITSGTILEKEVEEEKYSVDNLLEKLREKTIHMQQQETIHKPARVQQFSALQRGRKAQPESLFDYSFEEVSG